MLSCPRLPSVWATLLRTHDQGLQPETGWRDQGRLGRPRESGDGTNSSPNCQVATLNCMYTTPIPNPANPGFDYAYLDPTAQILERKQHNRRSIPLPNGSLLRPAAGNTRRIRHSDRLRRISGKVRRDPRRQGPCGSDLLPYHYRVNSQRRRQHQLDRNQSAAARRMPT